MDFGGELASLIHSQHLVNFVLFLLTSYILHCDCCTFAHCDESVETIYHTVLKVQLVPHKHLQFSFGLILLVLALKLLTIKMWMSLILSNNHIPTDTLLHIYSFSSSYLNEKNIICLKLSIKFDVNHYFPAHIKKPDHIPFSFNLFKL